MNAFALIAVLLSQPASMPAGRYEMGVRLQKLDRVWLANKDVSKRKLAVESITGAVMAFFGGQTAQACRSLDAAIITLDSRIPQPNGINLRADPPYAPVGGSVKLRVIWAYPGINTPVKVQLNNIIKVLKPNEAMELEVLSKDLPLEKGQRIAKILINGELYDQLKLDEINQFPQRLQALKSGSNPVVLGLVEGISNAIQPSFETTMPLKKMLLDAEALESGKLKVENFREVYAAKAGTIPLRARFPKKLSQKPVVLIALHGAGGSENMFFDAYGAGMAPQFAEKRGWIFISPRSESKSVASVLKWLFDTRGIVPGKLFVMGHSMGGGLTLQSGASKPDAVAFFAPAGNQIPENLQKTPKFLAVGENEIGMLKTSSARLATQLGENSLSKIYPNCEHLMIVADALPDAFKFFDNTIKESQ